MAESILKSFDVWTAVQGLKSKGRVKSIDNISLEGITKLRELILELAVRGKLVPQDELDEPASELLIRIRQEQEAGGISIRKEKLLPNITEREMPFDLPIGWQFVRLQQIIQISSGDGLTSSQMQTDGNIPVYGGNGINGYHDKANISKPTLVIGRVGFYCGSIHITPPNAWVTDNAFITYFSEENIDINFLAWLLKATDLKENDSATAQPVISGRKIYPIVVGLPPLPEQQRIVAKVDELMAFCDKLEAVQTTNLKTHQALVKTLLQTLTNATNADELHKAWQRLSPHFDTLFCTEDSIEQLKQTILQLAIMGRLVKQSPTDEPATALLKRIKAEKACLPARQEKLVKSGKLEKGLPAEASRRRQKELTTITDDEIPFELPDGWVWCRLGDITTNVDYGTSEKATEKGEIPILRMGNVQEGKVVLNNLKYVRKAIKDLPRLFLKRRDIIFNRTNSYELVGKCGIFEGADDEYTLASYLIRVSVPHNLISVDYVNYYVNSPNCRETQIEPQVTQQTGQANFSGGKLKNILIPLPPLAEQQRIVAKVQQLQQQLSQLEARLQQSSIYARQLMETVLQQAFEEKGKLYEMQEGVLSMVAEGD